MVSSRRGYFLVKFHPGNRQSGREAAARRSHIGRVPTGKNFLGMSEMLTEPKVGPLIISDESKSIIISSCHKYVIVLNRGR